MSKTPKLRFKEFSGEWESKKLRDVSQIIGGGTPSTTKNEYWNGNIPWFTPTEIKIQKFVSMSERTITEEGLKKSSAKILPKGTVLLTTRASLGDMAIASQDVTTNQGFQSIIAGDDISNEFIYYLQPKLKKYCYKNASGSTFLEISKSNIEQFKFNMPSKEEQEKIASFFSLIDDKISLQGDKVEALKDYKKGMMQKIFSRELRFKDDDGRDYPEWEERKLGDIGNFLSGGSLSKNDLSKSGVKCILYGDLFTEYTEVINDIRNYTNKKEKLVYGEYNTLLFPTSTTVDAISLICPSALMIKEKVILGGDMSVFKPMIDNVICSFLSYQINGYLKHEFSKKAQGSTIIHIYGSDLQTCRVLLPCIEEQLKITQLLYSLDKKIEKEQEKLNYLNEYKKGLLQQMFV